MKLNQFFLLSMASITLLSTPSLTGWTWTLNDLKETFTPKNETMVSFFSGFGLTQLSKKDPRMLSFAALALHQNIRYTKDYGKITEVSTLSQWKQKPQEFARNALYFALGMGTSIYFKI